MDDIMDGVYIILSSTDPRKYKAYTEYSSLEENGLFDILENHLSYIWKEWEVK